jgi:4-methyl-5(b-hydroxyethyl)-thiazole monophosphate biosynthesis
MLKKQKQSGKYYAAICASPAMVFEPHGLLEGEAGTCYPSMQGELKNQEKVKQRVVVSNKCITSQGPCTALEFGYALCEELFSKEKAEQLKKGMVFY